MVGKTGFEPATPWSQTRCTTKLCYFPFNGALGRNRTHNLLIRSQALYPVELLAHFHKWRFLPDSNRWWQSCSLLPYQLGHGTISYLCRLIIIWYYHTNCNSFFLFNFFDLSMSLSRQWLLYNLTPLFVNKIPHLFFVDDSIFSKSFDYINKNKDEKFHPYFDAFEAAIFTLLNKLEITFLVFSS